MKATAQRTWALLAWVMVLMYVNVGSAAVVRGIDIEFVHIGNAGNVPDMTGYGAVSYDYYIGKYEVTNAQWDAFTTAAGAPTGNSVNGYNPYDESAAWPSAQQPTDYVSWYEALQFCNYLTSGDKSKGPYQFTGNNANPGDLVGTSRAVAELEYGDIYYLPTENEWYKAAYYSETGYSTYANGTSTPPVEGVETNYNFAIGTPWNVGMGVAEQNGTFDMMGNFWEWHEASNGHFRGGSYGSASSALCSSFRYWDGSAGVPPYDERGGLGFRVTSNVPEPCSLVLLSLGGLAVQGRRKPTGKSGRLASTRRL